MKDDVLTMLVNSLAKLEQVEAIALAGSHSVQMNDSLSDYDLYIYVKEMIPVEVRAEITQQYCSYIELNNQFWETEDDGVLSSGIEIELIYRDLAWLDDELNKTIFQHQVNTGYSTCFWANLRYSMILFDRDQKLTELQKKYDVDYSDELADAIIAKNLPLISDAFPAYPKQIAKALKRNDSISVHHRITEYLASYFDILFAINRLPHPGEKRLVQFALRQCRLLPVNFEQTIEKLLLLAGLHSAELPKLVEGATNDLRALADER